MSSNGRMGRNPFQKKATPAPVSSGEAEVVQAPAEPVQFIAAPTQVQEQPAIQELETQEPESDSSLDSDSDIPSWMTAVAITYRVALLTRFGAQVAVSEAQQFLHQRLQHHQQAKRHGRA